MYVSSFMMHRVLCNLAISGIDEAT